MLEVREGYVAAVSRDLVHRPFCLHQQAAGAGHTEFVDVTRNSASRGLFEQATEGAFAQVGQAGQFRRVQRLSQVFFNVLADTADAVCPRRPCDTQSRVRQFRGVPSSWPVLPAIRATAPPSAIPMLAPYPEPAARLSAGCGPRPPGQSGHAGTDAGLFLPTGSSASRHPGCSAETAQRPLPRAVVFVPGSASLR